MVSIFMDNKHAESKIKTVIDIAEKVFCFSSKKKDLIQKYLEDNRSFSIEVDTLKLTVLPRNRFFIVGFGYAPLDMKEEYVDKLINFSIEVCKRIDVLSLSDNSLIPRGGNIFAKLLIFYMNMPHGQIESEIKQHYIHYFDKTKAYKKLLINNNPFLVFIEDSARRYVENKNNVESTTKCPSLKIKDVVTNKEYVTSLNITKITMNQQIDYKIVIGNPPKTFFHYEYYAQGKDLAEALNHVENKFKERGYQLVLNKKEIMSEFSEKKE